MNRNFFGGRGGRGVRPRPTLGRTTRGPTSAWRGREVACRYVHVPRRNSSDYSYLRTGRQFTPYQPNAALVDYADAPPPLYRQRGLVRYGPIRRSRSAVKMLVGFVAAVVVRSVRAIVGGAFGLLTFLTLRGRSKSTASLVDTTEAENKRLWERIQAMKTELEDKDEQLSGLRRVNNVYVSEQIPELYRELERRDTVIKNFQQADRQGNMDVLLELHSKLRSRDNMISRLTSKQTTAKEEMKEFEKTLEHRNTQLSQARQQLVDCAKDIESLSRQVKEKDDLILSLSVGEGVSRESEILRRRIWEQTKVIESLRSGVGQPSRDETVAILQKEVQDQDYIINSLRRRLELAGIGAQTMDVLFFPDDRAQTNLFRLLEYINNAERSLDICASTIASDEISDAVINAHKRGVAVRVIVDEEQGPSRGSSISKMESAGIPVKLDTSQFHLHQKYCIIDKGMLANGSFDWTQRGIRYEQGNVVLYDDKQLVEVFSEEFERLWGLFA